MALKYNEGMQLQSLQQKIDQINRSKINWNKLILNKNLT